MTKTEIHTVEESIYSDLTESIFQSEEGGKKEKEIWFLLGTLRDYLTDHDRIEEGEAIHWLVENQKRPYVMPRSAKKEGEAQENPEQATDKTKNKASWFNADTIGNGLGDPSSDLPGGLFEEVSRVGLEEKRGKLVANHHAFDTVQEAVVYAIKGYACWKSKGFPEKKKEPEKK